MKPSYISVQRLTKSYGTHAVLKGVSIQVERGEIFALLGENGAGKTTTVNILSTLIRQDGGSAVIGGYDSLQEPAAIRRLISVTGQYATVDEQLTGEENLLMMGRLHHLSKSAANARTTELLQQFDLTDDKKRLVKTYSGGMRRRLDIAISLIGKPDILFLDEPTTGLDPRSRQRMWALIRELADQGMTVLLTTQYLEEADLLADRIAVLSGGEIVASGTSSELKALMSGDRLDLTFATKEEAVRAAQLLAEEVTRVQEEVVSVALSDSVAHMRVLLNILHERSCHPVDAELRKPTLDDVFIQLTERREQAV